MPTPIRTLLLRSVVWAVLAVPAGAQTWRYLTEEIYYGEYLHWTGEQAARFLIVTLAVTPLRLAFPRARVVGWLMAHRRDFGGTACRSATISAPPKPPGHRNRP